MYEQWNQAWRVFAEKEKMKWQLRLPPRYCDFLHRISFQGAAFDEYETYDVYTAEMRDDDSSYHLIIETRFPWIMEWSLVHEGNYRSLQDYFQLSKEEYREALSIFNRSSLLKWILLSSNAH
jgi:hypothetical protein